MSIGRSIDVTTQPMAILPRVTTLHYHHYKNGVALSCSGHRKQSKQHMASDGYLFNGTSVIFFRDDTRINKRLDAYNK